MEPAALKLRIKEMMIEELMLDDEPDEIEDEAPIFGPEGLGLDSVDALQLSLALDKHFALKVGDQDRAKEILQSVNTIAAAIEKEGKPEGV